MTRTGPHRRTPTRKVRRHRWFWKPHKKRGLAHTFLHSLFAE
ncbi:hypothetical protein [Lysobacter gummosus]